MLYKDENTGAIALAFDPTNPQTVYAVLWAAAAGPVGERRLAGHRQRPLQIHRRRHDLAAAHQGTAHAPRTAWAASASPSRRATRSASTPWSMPRGRAASTAPTTPARAGGASTTSTRVWGRGSDFAEVKVDPKNKDVVYVANTSTYRSTDGGKTFTAFKGAPGGDDYHTIWINPDNPQIILLASDQGATITRQRRRDLEFLVQPADGPVLPRHHRQPVPLLGLRRPAGERLGRRRQPRQRRRRSPFANGIRSASRSTATSLPTRSNPNIIYGGKVTRFDRTTGQVQDVAPEALRTGKYRFLRTAPLLFSPVDPHVLYFGGQRAVQDHRRRPQLGGHQSRPVAREPEVPESVGIYRTPELATQPRRGVIYTVAPSLQGHRT